MRRTDSAGLNAEEFLPTCTEGRPVPVRSRSLRSSASEELSRVCALDLEGERDKDRSRANAMPAVGFVESTEAPS